MSQYPPPGFPKTQKYPLPEGPRENGWGLAGFIVSMAGLFVCGIPSLIGAVISAIGLRKEPRGFAIAGLFVGLLGVFEFVAFGLFLFTMYRAADAGISAVRTTMIESQLNFEATTIGEVWEQNSRIPTQSEGNDLLAGKRDVIGNSIVYETDGASFSLRSAGRDGILRTNDDVVAGPFNDAKSAIQFPTGAEMDFDFDKLRDELDSLQEPEGLDDLEERLKSMQDALDKAELE